MASISSNERMRQSEEKAQKWLTSVDPDNYDDLESVVESIAQSSLIDSSDTESGEEQLLGTKTKQHAAVAEGNFSDDDDEAAYNDIKELPNYSDLNSWDCIQTEFINRIPQATYSNISISNATNVVLGNVIKIKGDLIVNVNNTKNSGPNDDEKVSSKPPLNPDEREEFEENNENIVKNESNSRQQKTASPKYRPPCLIVPRTSWLAMDPLDEYDRLEEPVDLVVISHTATTSATEQSKNIGIIRDIQTFHIETRGWNDIGYNFLIGCDGNVYEGRGWGIEGAHTFGYNRRSIGISFIGCFMRKLPTPRALQACKKILQRGTDEGHLTPTFKLMGHRQCTSTESPGSKLFEEISTWEHFHETVKDELNESESE